MNILQQYPALMMHGSPQKMAGRALSKGAGVPVSYVAQFDSGWGYGGHMYTSLDGDLAKDSEKTLYVLLVKDKDAVDVDEGGGSSIEGDWHIRESQLTRHVDTDISNPKTLDLRF